ncbi:hypothetical protein [Oceanispirochaeta sp.]|jgi:hypothetical protein|uniref:hypothetical protein n=1 Tax=Oceanispirochaeta sp. TaxID=2035350 RepID=UPI002606A689|nr:hypothetical protein [Oceanispirochaeta sp.]MDA3958389.1 hypothetical protein [Oceanispirochaeta sp.]
MNIALAKWLIEKADGFELTKRNAPTSKNGKWKMADSYCFTRCEKSHSGNLIDIDESIVYPILLQGAIEGVNRENGKYRIEQMYNEVEVLDSEEYTVEVSFHIRQGADKAKELSLMYVKGHENANTKD